MSNVKLFSTKREDNEKMLNHLHQLFTKSGFLSMIFFVIAGLLLAFFFWIMTQNYFLEAFGVILLFGFICYIFLSIGTYWCTINDISTKMNLIGFSPLVLWIISYKFLSSVSWDKYFIYMATAVITYFGTKFIIKSQKTNQ